MAKSYLLVLQTFPWTYYPLTGLVPQLSSVLSICKQSAMDLHLTYPCRALDFLYIDYKPPQPLNVLITPEILSKYQRIFAFLLRLTRGKPASVLLFILLCLHT